MDRGTEADGLRAGCATAVLPDSAHAQLPTWSPSCGPWRCSLIFLPQALAQTPLPQRGFPGASTPSCDTLSSWPAFVFVHSDRQVMYTCDGSGIVYPWLDCEPLPAGALSEPLSTEHRAWHREAARPLLVLNEEVFSVNEGSRLICGFISSAQGPYSCAFHQ